jgi:hypothetical protein
VRVAERVWRTQQKNYVWLLPEAIGITPRGRSKRLERVLTDFGSEHSFQHSAARVQEHYGMSATVVLRLKEYRERHAAIGARVLLLAERFQQERGYPPPYWELVRLAGQALMSWVRTGGETLGIIFLREIRLGWRMKI